MWIYACVLSPCAMSHSMPLGSTPGWNGIPFNGPASLAGVRYLFDRTILSVYTSPELSSALASSVPSGNCWLNCSCISFTPCNALVNAGLTWPVRVMLWHRYLYCDTGILVFFIMKIISCSWSGALGSSANGGNSFDSMIPCIVNMTSSMSPPSSTHFTICHDDSLISCCIFLVSQNVVKSYLCCWLPHAVCHLHCSCAYLGDCCQPSVFFVTCHLNGTLFEHITCSVH